MDNDPTPNLRAKQSNSHMVGVVTVTYNSASVIDDFLQSILQQTYSEFILYVVDSASSDATLQQLASYHDPRIVVFPQTTNVGIAEGNNIGVRAAIADGCGSVLLINNDTVFDSTLLAELQSGLAGHGCRMVAPKIVYFDNPGKLWSAGGYFSRLWGGSRHFGLGLKDSGQFDQLRFVDFSPACCLLVEIGVFQQVGLIDQEYFVYFDDTDFCYRTRKAGIRILYLPSAKVSHKVSSLTGGSESEFTLRYCVRNEAYFILKNFPTWQIPYYLAALQFRILCRQITSRRSLKTLWMIESAFRSGVNLYRTRSQELNDAVMSPMTTTDVEVGAKN